MFKTLFQIPNLLSMTRVLLVPFVGYYLAKGDSRSTLICVVLLLVAGITDGLDGYFARRLNQVSKLGIALDPIADKIFAGALVILLIFYRDFPIWLAVIIVSRDLLILIAGVLLLKGKKLVLPSNITGKYTFTAIIFLLGSYVIRFDFGITLMTYLSVILIVASTIIYARLFIFVKKGQEIPLFKDRTVYKMLRVGVSIVILIIFCYKLLVEFIL